MRAWVISLLLSTSAWAAGECPDYLRASAPISIEEARLWRKLNNDLATPQPRPMGFRARLAALEYIHQHSKDALLKHPLKQVALGVWSLDNVQRIYPEIRWEDLIEKSVFLRRMERERVPLTVSEVQAPQLFLNSLQTTSFRVGLKKLDFERWDALLEELKRYPRFEDRLVVLSSVIPRFGPITWSEALEALDLLSRDAEIQLKAARVLKSAIFTPVEFYSWNIAYRVRHFERYAGRSDAEFRARWYRSIGAVALSAAILGGGLRAKHVLAPTPEEISSRVNEYLAQEQYALDQLRKGESHRAEIQMLFAQSGDLNRLLEVPGDADVGEDHALEIAGALAPQLGVEQYRSLFVGSFGPAPIHSAAAKSVAWAYFVQKHREDLDLRWMIASIGSFSIPDQIAEIPGSEWMRSAVYADYVLAPGHFTLPTIWWLAALDGAPDSETRDGLALAFVGKRGKSLNTTEAQTILQRIKSPSLRDQAAHLIATQAK